MINETSVGHSFDHIRSEMLNDFLCHAFKVEFWCPTPVLTGHIIFQIMWPAVGNTLPQCINLIVYFKVRNILLDLSSQLTRVKCDAVDVV